MTHVGPTIPSENLIYLADFANEKSFKGGPIDNLYYIDASASVDTDIWSTPYGGTAVVDHSDATSTYGTYGGSTIWGITVGSGTMDGNYSAFRRCLDNDSLIPVYGSTRSIQAKVKMISGDITDLGLHTNGGNGAHNAGHWTAIDESEVPDEVFDKSGWYLLFATCSSTASPSHCVGIAALSSEIEFLATEMMVFPGTDFVHYTDTSRGGTVAAGGGVEDLAGSINGEINGDLVATNSNNGGGIFDGSTTYIDLNSASELNFTSGNYTAIFVAQHDGTAGSNHRVLSFGDYQTTGWEVFLDGTHIQHRMYDGTAEAHGYSSVNTQLLAHYAVVDDGANSLIYYNAQAPSSAGRKDAASHSGDTFIGEYTGGGSYYFSGDLYYVAIYDTALSADEIEQHFNAVRGRFGL